MVDFYLRLEKETSDLHDKIEKLRNFIWDDLSGTYDALHKVDQHLLVEQLAAMRQYKGILFKRLGRSYAKT